MADHDKILHALLAKTISLHENNKMPGAKDLISSLVGALGEAIVLEYTNGKMHNKNYDIFGNVNCVGRIEVKTCFKPTNGQFGAWSLLGKRGKCDWFAFVDASKFMENKYRVAFIPHDEMFAVLDAGTKKGRQHTAYQWSATYNESDKIKPAETALYMKYMVDIVSKIC